MIKVRVRNKFGIFFSFIIFPQKKEKKNKHNNDGYLGSYKNRHKSIAINIAVVLDNSPKPAPCSVFLQSNSLSLAVIWFYGFSLLFFPIYQSQVRTLSNRPRSHFRFPLFSIFTITHSNLNCIFFQEKQKPKTMNSNYGKSSFNFDLGIGSSRPKSLNEQKNHSYSSSSSYTSSFSSTQQPKPAWQPNKPS